MSTHNVWSPRSAVLRCTVARAELVEPPVPRASWNWTKVDIASNSDLEGDRVTDLRFTARLGGTMGGCVLWKFGYVETVSCEDGRLDPAQDQDLLLNVMLIMTDTTSLHEYFATIWCVELISISDVQ